ncbi:MAG TPA: PKD domain-containing protein [Fimbriimonadaceae bacterium]|nr:PKD domain-containing protein [Fimbriimonadaceae bacterium]
MKLVLKSATLAAVVALCGAGYTQELYSPNISIDDQGITVTPWGSGTIAETTETANKGSASIRVSSRNFYQGGTLTFTKGFDLSKEAGDKSNLLVFSIHAPTNETVIKGGGKSAGTTSGPGGGTTGAGQTNSPEFEIKALMTKVRCVIITTDDKRTEVYLDLSNAISNSAGWKTVGVPLVSIPGFTDSNKTIKSIAFSGDTIATFYIGSIRILNDTTPLYVEPTVHEMNLALGDTVTLSAIGSGGSSQLKYTWDFDASDGVDVDADGQVVKRTFRKPGDYTITVTVHDVFGLKKPYSNTIHVVVNP